MLKYFIGAFILFLMAAGFRLGMLMERSRWTRKIKKAIKKARKTTGDGLKVVEELLFGNDEK
jgi:hypothetical protein